MIESVHQLAEGQPLRDRIELYRAHAGTTGCASIAKHLFACADELEAADERCQQMRLEFNRST